MQIPYEVKSFLEKQHFVIMSSVNSKSVIHTSAKGVIEVNAEGKIFILDLYKGQTYRNIKNNSNVTLTAIDEHRFKGYSMEGTARIVKEDSVPKNKLEAWHDKVAKRIARRVIRHVKEEKSGHEGVPEARFPFPKYLIEISVNGIVDLAPHKKV